MIGQRSLLAPLVLLFFTLFGDVLAGKSSGCGKNPSISSGVRTMNVKGKDRSYIVTVPGGYNQNTGYKLIIGLHWYGGTKENVAYGQGDLGAYYGLPPLSGNSAIFVAPQADGLGWFNVDGADITFVDNIISTIESSLCVEQTQRFALGFSYGAAMTSYLACSRPTTFRGVAAISAGDYSPCSNGANSVAYFGIHGLRDEAIPIAQGRALRDRFVRNNGCQPQNPPEPAQGSLSHVRTKYNGCRADKPVWWLAFDAGHQAAPQDGSTRDSASKSYLPGELWSFFSQFSGGGGGGNNPPQPTTTAAGGGGGGGGAGSPLYGQCGGIGWTGPTRCSAGSCKYSNDYYSQCLN